MRIVSPGAAAGAAWAAWAGATASVSESTRCMGISWGTDAGPYSPTADAGSGIRSRPPVAPGASARHLAKTMRIRPFEPADADTVSRLIATTMRESNGADYSGVLLEPLISYFTPARLVALSAERETLVAERDGAVVGTAALEGDTLQSFFVLPGSQGQGVGRKPLAALERIAASAELRRLYVESSVTGARFYERSGYRRYGDEIERSAGRQIPMVKTLPAPGGSGSQE